MQACLQDRTIDRYSNENGTLLPYNNPQFFPNMPLFQKNIVGEHCGEVAHENSISFYNTVSMYDLATFSRGRYIT